MTWLLSLISMPKLLAGIGALVGLVLGVLGIRKSGKDAAEIMAAMEAETWYTSDEAIAFGLADSKAELAALAYAIPQEFGYRNGPKPASIERPDANIAALKRKFDLTKARRSA